MPWGRRGGDWGCYLPGRTWGSLTGVPFRPGGHRPEGREGGKDSLLPCSFVSRQWGEAQFHDTYLCCYLWASILVNEGNNSSH